MKTFSRTFLACSAFFLLAGCVAEPGSPGAFSDRGLVSRAVFAAAGWRNYGALEAWKQSGNEVNLKVSEGRVAFLRFLSPSVFLFRLPDGPGKAPGVGQINPAELAPVSLKVREDAETLVIDSGTLVLKIKKSDLSWKVDDGSQAVLAAKSPERSGSWTRQDLIWGQNAELSGLGPTGRGWIKNGQSLKFWNDLPGNVEETSLFDLPFVFSWATPVPYAVFLDNPGQTYAKLSFPSGYLGSLEGGLDLYVLADEKARSVLSSWSDLIGHPSWGPSWSVGTKAVVDSQAVAQDWRKTKLAVQTVIGDPDGKLVGSSYRREGDLGWNRPATSVGQPDFSRPEIGAKWMGEQATAAPVAWDGWNLGRVLPAADWTMRYWDDGRNSNWERANNLESSWVASRARDALQTLHPGQRPWLTGETGSVGTISQAEWLTEVSLSDDPSDELDSVLSAQLSGLGSVEVRVDAKALTTDDAREAWSRFSLWSWSPYFCFDPGSDSEAWWNALGDKGKARLKAVLDERSRFQPYIYELTRQASLFGLPVWRPLAFVFPKDPGAASVKGEFLVGDNLLIAAPSDGSARKVYLPGHGSWFDVRTDEEFAGGNEYDAPSNEDGKVAVFVRSGSMIPTQEPFPYSGKEVLWATTVQVWPGAPGSVELWWDDGLTWRYQTGLYSSSRVTFVPVGREMDIEIEGLHGSTSTNVPFVLFRVHDVFRPRGVTLDEQALPVFGDSWGVTDTDRSAAWYESDHSLLIKVFHPEKSQTLRLEF